MTCGRANKRQRNDPTESMLSAEVESMMPLTQSLGNRLISRQLLNCRLSLISLI